MKHHFFAVESSICVMVRNNMTQQIREESEENTSHPASSERIRQTEGSQVELGLGHLK